MDSYRPQSPDLSSYAPQSPDLSGLQPQSPNLSIPLPGPRYGHHHSLSRDHFKSPSFEHQPHSHGYMPTSVPSEHQSQYDRPQQQMPPRRFKTEDEDDEYLPDAPAKRTRRTNQMAPSLDQSESSFDIQPTQSNHPLQRMSAQSSDPTLGVQLKTSFPVARIKRIMQADDDIGKVAQVTPHVVSRALELFMIKLISVSAAQARGSGPTGSGKGPKRILAQHMKKAIKMDQTLDFLEPIVDKVPDVPAKGKKEVASDSEDGGGTASKSVKKKGKKRKDPSDED